MPLRFKVCHMRNHQGFTLIELMVTVIIVAVLVAVATPAMRDTQANMRVSSVANNYMTLLKGARSDAILKNRHVTVAAIATSPPASNNWGGVGWLVTENINGNPSPIAEVKDLANTITMVTDPANINGFRFVAGTGLAQKTDASLLNVKFTVCDTGSSKERGYDILLNQFGRIFMTRHASSIICNP
jgi:type IV fimbrial biogenesis protein FimT